MILVLNNGKKVEIFRQNCGYEGHRQSRIWNIDPANIISSRPNGCFVIAKWGTIYSDPFDKMIPVSSVSYIMDSSIWDYDDKKNDVDEEIVRIGFKDTTGIDICLGDTCQTYDHTGKKWIGKIVKVDPKRIVRSQITESGGILYAFKTNYETWINNQEYASSLAVIAAESPELKPTKPKLEKRLRSLDL